MDLRQIGPFVLEDKLGAGGMAVVYLARHETSGKHVALKVMAAKLAGSKRALARFNREIEILKKLKHPNIVRCFGGGQVDGHHFLAMELVRGGSLASQLRRRGRFTWEAAVDYALQICSALEFAHENGVIHRDLTPGNLLLTEGGTIKIADFGLARLTYGERLTATQHTLGTVAYMAPEQIRGDKPATHQTDLYTLGCVLFEMLTGRLPFVAATTAEMLYQHLDQSPPRVSSLVLDCPVWLDGLVLQLMAKKAEDRPRDAAAVAVALKEVKERVAQGSGVAAHAVGGGASTLRVTADITSAARLFRRRRKPTRDRPYTPWHERTAVLAVLLLLVAGAVTWAVWPASEESLFLDAKALMEDPEATQMARLEILDKLQRRFPEGRYAQEVQGYVDEVEMERAEKQADSHVRQGREPQTEGERLYLEARRYENFGDALTALEKYEALVTILSDQGEDRPFVNLARRQIAALATSDADKDKRLEMINRKLDQADELYAGGKAAEASRIYTSVISLYENNRELRPQVRRAQAGLAANREEDDDEAPDQPGNGQETPAMEATAE